MKWLVCYNFGHLKGRLEKHDRRASHAVTDRRRFNGPPNGCVMCSVLSGRTEAAVAATAAAVMEKPGRNKMDAAV